MVLVGLSACSTLPTSGPVGRSIINDGKRGLFDLVEINSDAALPPTEPLKEFQPLPPAWDANSGVLAPGDVITVTVYEVGARLFSGGGAAAAPGGGFDPSAKAEKVGPIEIDRVGRIHLPYLGRIQAAGQTPVQLAELVERKLLGKSENPQVVVTLDAANGSGILIGGEIVNPGRVRLSNAGEKLLDVINLAGGYRGTPSDILVRVYRGRVVSEGPLDALDYNNIGGMPMEAGDRIELIRRPRSYSVLGSANKVSQYNLPVRQTSLIEGLASAGGASENLASPAAVFVFRYVASQDGKERPTVYHFNMMKPSSYLLAQKFTLNDKDVIYVGGAQSNQPSKLLQIIGQIFTPAILTRQLTN
jgi:polysaccharide biosynthesis/export protein